MKYLIILILCFGKVYGQSSTATVSWVKSYVASVIAPVNTTISNNKIISDAADAALGKRIDTSIRTAWIGKGLVYRKGVNGAMDSIFSEYSIYPAKNDSITFIKN